MTPVIISLARRLRWRSVLSVIRLCFWVVGLGTSVLLGAAQPVPIFEREMPTDPVEQKKYFAELERALKAMETETKAETAKSLAAALVPKREPVEVQLPPRDDAQIRTASRVLTEQSLPAEIAGLRKQLRAGLDRESIEDADRFIKVYGSNSGALATAAAVAWVEQAPGPALLLAAEAAQRSPGSANALNTLGSLLVEAGYAGRGIPLLAHLAKKFPGDPTLENNLGQAWLGIGAPELAKPRLLACLTRAPGHGAAHAALGMIATSTGDDAAATKHFQTAVASNGSPVSRRALKQLDEGFRTARSFLRAFPVQTFFNPHHFVLPAGQRSIAAAEQKQAEISAFSDMISERIDRVGAAMNEAAARLAQQPGIPNLAFSQTLAPAGGVIGFNLAQASGAAEGRERRTAQFLNDLNHFVAKSDALWQAAAQQVDDVRKAFEKRWANSGPLEGGGAEVDAYVRAQTKLCGDCQKIMEDALPAIAQSYDAFVLEVSTRERVAINEELTYLPLRSGGDLYLMEFHSLVLTHLQHLGMMAAANPVRTYKCGPSPALGPVAAPEGELPSPGTCPINLKFNLGVAKLKGDCKSIGIDFEAGLKFSAKKSFESGETTLKGGVGTDLKLGAIGQVEGGGQFVLVWDRGNSLSFIGVESSASASLSGIPGLSGELDTGAGTALEATLPTGSSDLVNVSSATTLGVTLGPRGMESKLSGSSAAEVLGRDLVKAELK